MIISIICICFYCTVYMTIFFFTLTTYVAHGDVNINVMLMSMLYNMICDPSEPHNKKEQVDILITILLAYQ